MGNHGSYRNHWCTRSTARLASIGCHGKKEYDSGKLDDAERDWREALSAAEATKNVEPGVVGCLRSLSLLNEKRGNGAEAERLYELAMRNMEGLVGPTDPRFADCMPGLAWLYDAHGKISQAEILFRRALSIKEKNLGADDPLVADLLDNYARFLRKNNRPIEAASVETRASRIRDKSGL